MDKSAILAAITPVLARYDVPLPLVYAIIQVESAWNPLALGDNGTSFGLFQLHINGGQGDQAIADGHKAADLYDPVLNATYAMPAIAAVWDALKASFDAWSMPWWFAFAAQSGHPGGSATDPATIGEATKLFLAYHQGETMELENFPMISQRDADANADFDCVPASIAACLQWLTGHAYKAGEIKDAVYGASYVGGTAASAYVAYCASQDVTLAPMDGNGSQLVADLRAQIAAGHPCLITEPDPYAAGWTHVCAAYKDDGANIVVMDPWIDQPVTKSYGEWATQLQDNEIWTLALEDEMISLSDPFVTAHFTQTGSNPDRLHCKETGFDLFAGILGGWRRMNGAPRLPKSGEVKCGKTAVYVECEGGIVVYDPDKELDAPAGPWAPCYLLHLDSDLAKKLLNIGQATQPAPTQIPASAIADLKALRASTDAGFANVLADLGAS